MATLSLKISLEGGAVTKTIQFDPQITVFDACKIIREKFAEAIHGKRKCLHGCFILECSIDIFIRRWAVVRPHFS